MIAILVVGSLIVAAFTWVLWVNKRDLKDVEADIRKVEEEEKAEEAAKEAKL
ncbi:MAG: hypothetical protein HQM01_12425 [Magnetococcales bacterium]|nr:hypothetical protein [Magnetococcales bacterium]